jgi:hypothetical protein
VEISGMVNYGNSENSFNYATVIVQLFQDAVSIAASVATPGAVPIPADRTWALNAAVPITWYLTGDGLPHVYSVTVTTDVTSNGNQIAAESAIFVNVIA